jgi:hypothetical protein
MTKAHNFDYSKNDNSHKKSLYYVIALKEQFNTGFYEQFQGIIVKICTNRL